MASKAQRGNNEGSIYQEGARSPNGPTGHSYLGIRPGEAAALSWADVDFENRIIHVRRGRKRLRGRIEIGTTKTPGSVRSLDAPAQVLDALRRRQREQRAERLRAGERWRSGKTPWFRAPGGGDNPGKLRICVRARNIWP